LLSRTIIGHTDAITQFKIIKDDGNVRRAGGDSGNEQGTFLISASADGSVKVWELRDDSGPPEVSDSAVTWNAPPLS
jgi:hypothetical protein